MAGLKTAVREWKFPSSSSDKTYTTVLWADGSYSCDCRGWTIKRAGQERNCRHCDEAREDAGAQVPKPEVAAKEAAPQKPKAFAMEHPESDLLKPFKPMLAQPFDKVLSYDLRSHPELADPRYVAEPKIDGQRGLVMIENHRTLAVWARPGPNGKQNEISDSNGLRWIRDVKWPIKMGVLDGEICSGSGLSRGQKSGKLARSTAGAMKAFMAFDCLVVNGEDLRHLPWTERRARLEQVIGKTKHECVSMTAVSDDAKALWREWVVKLGGEGIMLKDRSSWYVAGWRSPKWLKVPFETEVDVVIIGFTKKATYSSGGYRTGEGALTYGFYDPKKKRVVEIGQGLRIGSYDELSKLFGKVAVVKCKGITHTGALTSGRFVRWRDDKAPEECVMP